MDRLIYTAMCGAKATMQRQDALANNLANATTTGVPRRTVGVPGGAGAGSGAATRVFALEASAGFDATPGSVTQTGRTLDVAVRGDGWIAVQGLDGSEAYTRAGSFELSRRRHAADPPGPRCWAMAARSMVPPNSRVDIGQRRHRQRQSGSTPPVVVGQIKLVNPPAGRAAQAAPTGCCARSAASRRRRGPGRACGVGRAGRQQREPRRDDGRDDRGGAPVRDADEDDAGRGRQRPAGRAAAGSAGIAAGAAGGSNGEDR